MAVLSVAAEAITGDPTVSLLVDQPAVERIVYGAEFGRLWLTRQSEGIPADRDELTRQRLLDTLGSGGG